MEGSPGKQISFGVFAGIVTANHNMLYLVVVLWNHVVEVFQLKAIPYFFIYGANRGSCNGYFFAPKAVLLMFETGICPTFPS